MDQITKTLARIEKDLSELKLFSEKQKKQNQNQKKCMEIVEIKKIEHSKTKKDLSKFTAEELFVFSQKHKINIKKTLSEFKKGLIDDIKKHIDKNDSAESESDYESD